MRYVRFFIFLSILFVIGFALGATLMTKFLTFSAPPEQPRPVTKEVLQATAVQSSFNHDIEEIVRTQLGNTNDRYAIVVQKLASDERFTYNENQVFDTASLYKLWVMATVIDIIGKGGLDFTDVLKRDIAVLNSKFRIASESAERSEGVIEQTVDESLNKMITISDNYSSLLLTEKIRLSKVATYLKSNNFTESKVGNTKTNPVSTASDIALFFEKLYRGEMVDSDSSELMLEILKNQRLNTKIPKLLPDDVVIAHKTGELSRFTHDAGIIYTPKGDYILVVLSEVELKKDGDEMITQLSKSIYSYIMDD